MVTSRDVARLAGVSQPTVSRALRDDPKVSEATKRQVREAAAALGYAPNAIGRALSLGRSTRVGLVVTDLRNQFYTYVIAPMHHELARAGYELVLITETSESGPVTEHVVANGLSGVVLATTTTDSILPVRLGDRGVPFVYFNRTARNVPADSVVVDPEPGMTALVKDIVAQGHTRVGAVFGAEDTSTGQVREVVLRRLLLDQGIVLAERNVRHGPFDLEAGYGSTLQLLDQPEPPTLIICANDVVAIGALNAAAERGVTVPSDLSVVGFDDLPIAGFAMVQLSTIAYDLDAMSREAARLLVSRIEDPGVEEARSVVFPTSYVGRSTLGPAAS
ncbi:LacI family DNA-binding transcriptional regulator [Microlunatus soli]|uniref:Transcriptional regulator, LacI family n=1 Tax=Microlunatus soli TaxID=630515 RepID=A0A1H1ZU45_9ACTN|nr:LacI family DNA-binding transcriptional regulator [Microlunatus soli]SDT37315.1 transcriptional regulator, LacI family [Microlunatus soli]